VFPVWNSQRTDAPAGLLAGVTAYRAGNGDLIHAYVARPEGPGPYPGLVLAHHLPGWDELYREFARRFADHGYTAICPDLYCRSGHGNPDDVSAAVRAAGGASDELVVADLVAARDWLRALPTANGKVGVFGTCSGGRHALLAASQAGGFDAVADLWGGGVVTTPEELTPQRPVSVLDYTAGLDVPLLGLFGDQDQYPTPELVDRHEEELKKHGKEYEFHRYADAGHAFFYYHRNAYRPESAMDGWAKVFDFFGRHLSSGS
jgi:carboxymethylenebutenolidase